MIFAREVGESLTYKFAQAAADMKAHGREIISLGLGEPDFRTPQYVLDATCDAMNAGFTHYSATQGLPEFRELIAKDVNTRFSAKYTAADIVVTPGIKPAVFFALCALLEPGDEVVLFSPYYVPAVAGGRGEEILAVEPVPESQGTDADTLPDQ